MEEKLAELERKFEDLEARLASPGLSGQELTKLSTERAGLAGLVSLYREMREIKRQLAEAQDLLATADDDEMKEMVKAEVVELDGRLKKVQDEIKIELLPKDPNDSKNVILEVRAGTGGEEAALFAADLMRMYMRFADKQRWRTEVLSMTQASAGGVKEGVVLISGQNVYSRLKFESGVHRVQRVPTTEAQGRVHTSACTVAVLPEAEDVEINIDPKDLDIRVCRASGAGGQHINTTDSAVRIVHIPTGVVVECQDERSQHKNKERALKILKARLLEKAQADQSAAISADRKSQVGSGDRSERIRTYNFPQGRVTDHRINLTLYNLSEVIEGDVGGIMDALTADHMDRLLKESLNAN